MLTRVSCCWQVKMRDGVALHTLVFYPVSELTAAIPMENPCCSCKVHVGLRPVGGERERHCQGLMPLLALPLCHSATDWCRCFLVLQREGTRRRQSGIKEMQPCLLHLHGISLVMPLLALPLPS